MNDLIVELLQQCSVPDNQAEEYSKSKGLVIPNQKLDVAKFAELIIRECALVVHKKTGPKSALNVLEHFGVEE